MNESHILYIFAIAVAVILGGSGAIIVKILNASNTARLRDKEIYQRQWTQFLQTMKDLMKITVENTNSHMTVASALETINQIMQTQFRGDNNGKHN